MDTKKQGYISTRLKSFSYAISGIVSLVRTEPHAQLHFLATVGVTVAGIIRHVSPLQWAALAFAIGLVWVAEALNTAIEKLCDYACKGEIHPTIKLVKDISAGAVLLAVITSVAIALIVFFF